MGNIHVQSTLTQSIQHTPQKVAGGGGPVTIIVTFYSFWILCICSIFKGWTFDRNKSRFNPTFLVLLNKFQQMPQYIGQDFAILHEGNIV